MSDEIKRAERVREGRIKDAGKDHVKPKQSPTEFDKLMESNKVASNLQPRGSAFSRTATEEAIREATKRDNNQGEEKRRDDDESKDGRNSRQKTDRSDGRIAEQKVVAKGNLKQDSGSGGGSRHGGRDTSGGRRDLTRLLSKTSLKSVPVDLQGKFAAGLAKTQQANAQTRGLLTQEVLNKLVQYVRIGINKKGEKEMQIDLHERIFKGLKLKVTARGGKVGVHFKTSDAKGREVLEKNADAIRSALQKKGIDVDELTIS